MGLHTFLEKLYYYRTAIAICCWICIGAIQFGYDTSYFSGILATPEFVRQYGDYDAATGTYALSSRTESIITSMINVGEFIGAISASFIGDAIGRKHGLYVVCVLVVVGVTFQVSGHEVGTLITGRIILGLGVGLISNFVPLLVADCAPAECRGAMVCMYQFMIGVGLLVGTIVTNFTNVRTDSGAYRIPMAVQYIFPILLVIGLVFFIPESPRWLLQKSRREEARHAIRRLNKGIPGRDHLVEQELATLEADIKFTNGEKMGSWRNVFRWGPEGRKAYLLFALQAFQQASGVNFITGYGIVFFFQVGITNAFTIGVVLYTIGFPAIWIAQALIEKAGRRPLLIYGALLDDLLLMIMGGLGTISEKTANVSAGIVAMVFLFLFAFNISWGPRVWVCCSEIASGPNRGEIMSIATGTNWLFTWVITFTYPYLANDQPGSAGLGSKVGFIYGSLTVFAALWCWFLLPETKGKSLEEIEECFQKHVKVKEFKNFQCECVGGDSVMISEFVSKGDIVEKSTHLNRETSAV